MKKILLIVCIVFFIACSDESGVVVDESSFPSEVATSFELGDCTDERSGNTVFVTEEGSYYVCTESGWSKNIEPNLISSSDINLMSSSGICSSSSQVQVMPSGFYDCTTHNCVSTSFLNQEKLIAGEYGEILDSRDNKVYKVITIDSQTWMAQNLDYDPGDVKFYTVYDDGSSYISHYISHSSCYENSANNCTKYGRLYTWNVALNVNPDTVIRSSTWGKLQQQGICPDGWHIPSKEEWETLFKNVVDTSFYVYGHGFYRLKTSSEWGEYSHSTDIFGFSVLPAGYTIPSTGETFKPFSFLGVGEVSRIWSSKFDLNNDLNDLAVVGWFVTFRREYDYPDLFYAKNESYMSSVRCIKDIDYLWFLCPS